MPCFIYCFKGNLGFIYYFPETLQALAVYEIDKIAKQTLLSWRSLQCFKTFKWQNNDSHGFRLNGWEINANYLYLCLADCFYDFSA
jgi:hypothetical protein